MITGVGIVVICILGIFALAAFIIGFVGVGLYVPSNNQLHTYLNSSCLVTKSGINNA